MILSAAAVQIAVPVIVMAICARAAMLCAVRFFTRRKEKGVLFIIAAGSKTDTGHAVNAASFRVTLYA
jgi:hypothetical protein